MGHEDKVTWQGPFRIKTVRGEAYSVGGRRLIPVARIVSFGKARGTIGSGSVSGWGGGFALIVPVAIVEETAEGERRVAITDATSSALRGMFGAAMAITLFFVVVRWLARRSRRASAKR